MCHELADVARLDAPAVLDPDTPSQGVVVLARERPADQLHDTARVAGLGGAARPDRPDRFVRDHHGPRLFGVHAVERASNLLGHGRLGAPRIALLERLPHAQDRRHPVGEDRPELPVHERVVLTEELPAFGVADDHVGDPERLQHQG